MFSLFNIKAQIPFCLALLGGGATGQGESVGDPANACFGDLAGNGGPGIDMSLEFGYDFGVSRLLEWIHRLKASNLILHQISSYNFF